MVDRGLNWWSTVSMGYNYTDCIEDCGKKR